VRKAITFSVALLLVAFGGCAWRQRAEQKREAGYSTIRGSYAEEFKLGMTRKEVEGLLRAKKVDFEKICCIDERSAYADIIKIGKEHAPWFCEAHSVYIALQFAATEPHDALKIVDSDALRSVTVWHHLEGCL
jgi:hypothetical protein